MPINPSKSTPPKPDERGPSANELTAVIRLRISETYGRGAVSFRINVIGAKTAHGFVRSAPDGTSDLLGAGKGCVRCPQCDTQVPTGRPIAIEIKAGKDRMRPDQKTFQAAWISAGGIYIIARDADQCMADLAAALEGK